MRPATISVLWITGRRMEEGSGIECRSGFGPGGPFGAKVPVHGEFVITLRLASGTDRDNGAAKRSDQGWHGRAPVRQIFLLECCH